MLRRVSEDREPGARLLGLLGVGMAVCCGPPLLLGAGVAVGAAGVALGSGVTIAVAVILVTWGWRRRQRHDFIPGPGAENSASPAPTRSRRQAMTHRQSRTFPDRRPHAHHR